MWIYLPELHELVPKLHEIGNNENRYEHARERERMRHSGHVLHDEAAMRLGIPVNLLHQSVSQAGGLHEAIAPVSGRRYLIESTVAAWAERNGLTWMDHKPSLEV
jgi:hypothetical protein